MKRTILVTALMLLTGLVLGQSIGLSGIVSCGGDTEGLSASVGQPFALHCQSAGGGTLCEGVQEAQLVRVKIDTVMCGNDVEYVYDFHFTPPVLPGTYDSSHYVLNARYNYDSLTALHLVVGSSYEGYDTVYLLVSELPSDIHAGRNDVMHASVMGCDSLVHLMVYTCGDTVYDGDGNEYHSLFVGHDCWTRTNMQTISYTAAAAYRQGTGTVAPNMIYWAPEFPDTMRNLSTYGRLYTWYAAVGVPDSSTALPPMDVEGFVQGICPDGWHIPTGVNMNNLMNFGVVAIASDSLWIIPTGDNSTGFNALPAGYYNPMTHRFENLLLLTSFWSSVSVTEHGSKNTTIEVGCGLPFDMVANKSYGFSVRCVRD